MFEFCVLSSGSKANCLYFSDGETKLLIDCGLSARETARRLEEIGVDAEAITAVIITHEHDDHVKGVPVFANKCWAGRRGQVYANEETAAASACLNAPGFELRPFSSGTPFQIGAIRIHPFSIVHDAADPVAFRIEAGGFSLAVVTDLGQLTNLVREHVRNIDAIILEANHDPDLLAAAPYPWPVKQRIAGRSGHLSNGTAASLLEELNDGANGRLELIIAAHISEKSNTPELAVSSLADGWARGRGARSAKVVAASAARATERFVF